MTQLLKLEKLEAVLKKYNLKELAEGTLIPYDTLKNYSSGRTPLDSIPYRYLERISDYDHAKTFGYVSHSNLIVSSKAFDKLVDECRVNFDPYYEYLHCVETTNARFDALASRTKFDVVYYFIDSSIFADKNRNEVLGFDLIDKLATILSIGLGANVRIILREYKDLYKNPVVMANTLDVIECTYNDILNKLGLTGKQLLPRLSELSDLDLFKDLLKLGGYIESLESLDDRVNEMLSDIDNVTPDSFK